MVKIMIKTYHSRSRELSKHGARFNESRISRISFSVAVTWMDGHSLRVARGQTLSCCGPTLAATLAAANMFSAVREGRFPRK